MGGLNWIAFHLGRVSLEPGATDTVCCEEKPPACRDDRLCVADTVPLKDGEREGEASNCGLAWCLGKNCRKRERERERESCL